MLGLFRSKGSRRSRDGGTKEVHSASDWDGASDWIRQNQRVGASNLGNHVR